MSKFRESPFYLFVDDECSYFEDFENDDSLKKRKIVELRDTGCDARSISITPRNSSNNRSQSRKQNEEKSSLSNTPRSYKPNSPKSSVTKKQNDSINVLKQLQQNSRSKSPNIRGKIGNNNSIPNRSPREDKDLLESIETLENDIEEVRKMFEMTNDQKGRASFGEEIPKDVNFVKSTERSRENRRKKNFVNSAVDTENFSDVSVNNFATKKYMKNSRKFYNNLGKCDTINREDVEPSLCNRQEPDDGLKEHEGFVENDEKSMKNPKKFEDSKIRKKDDNILPPKNGEEEDKQNCRIYKNRSIPVLVSKKDEKSRLKGNTKSEMSPNETKSLKEELKSKVNEMLKNGISRIPQLKGFGKRARLSKSDEKGEGSALLSRHRSFSWRNKNRRFKKGCLKADNSKEFTKNALTKSKVELKFAKNEKNRQLKSKIPVRVAANDANVRKCRTKIIRGNTYEALKAEGTARDVKVDGEKNEESGEKLKLDDENFEKNEINDGGEKKGASKENKETETNYAMNFAESQTNTLETKVVSNVSSVTICIKQNDENQEEEEKGIERGGATTKSWTENYEETRRKGHTTGMKVLNIAKAVRDERKKEFAKQGFCENPPKDHPEDKEEQEILDIGVSMIEKILDAKNNANEPNVFLQDYFVTTSPGIWSHMRKRSRSWFTWPFGYIMKEIGLSKT